jgi:hypothetical protein
MIGIFSGFMSGVFGIGGGSVRIPLLNVVGLPLTGAFGINLLVIPISSLIGAVSHRKNIHWGVSVFMIAGGILGSVCGAILTGVIPKLTLAIIFVIVSVVTVAGMYFEDIVPETARKIRPTGGALASGAFILNVLTGMRGGSGGSLFPPFLKMMRLGVHSAIATSLFVTIFTASAAVMIYWYRGDITWLPALVVIAGSTIGVRMGSLLSLKTRPGYLKAGLSIFVSLLALVVIFRQI